MLRSVEVGQPVRARWETRGHSAAEGCIGFEIFRFGTHLVPVARPAAAATGFGRSLRREGSVAWIDRVPHAGNRTRKQDFRAETVDIRTVGSDYLGKWSFPVARIPRLIV